jgi:hypothetical protein
MEQHCLASLFYSSPWPVTVTSGPEQAEIKLFYWTFADMAKDGLGTICVMIIGKVKSKVVLVLMEVSTTP